jgi:hypothetical protein
MEKTWIRDFGLFAFVALVLFVNAPLGFGQAASDVKTAIVEVVVPIVDGNLADAHKAAEKLAFEKAVDLVLPTSMDAKTRADTIKNAYQHIKGFAPQLDHPEGNMLRMKYQCNVEMPAVIAAAPAPMPALPPNASGQMAQAQAGGGPMTPQGVIPPQPLPQVQPQGPIPSAVQTKTNAGENYFEVTWKPSETQVNPVEIRTFLQTSLNANVENMKINRGSLVFSLSSKVPAEQAREEIASHLVALGGGSAVKILDPNLVRPQPAPEAMIGGAEPRTGEGMAPPMAQPAVPAPPFHGDGAAVPPSLSGPNAAPTDDAAPPPDFVDPTLEQKN